MTPTPGYAAGNILNMLVQIGADLTGYDFSGLRVWGAWLQNVDARYVDLACTDVRHSVFTDTFGTIISVTFSPDGHQVAVGTASGEIRLWNLLDSDSLNVPQPHIANHDATQASKGEHATDAHDITLIGNFRFQGIHSRHQMVIRTYICVDTNQNVAHHIETMMPSRQMQTDLPEGVGQIGLVLGF